MWGLVLWPSSIINPPTSGFAIYGGKCSESAGARRDIRTTPILGYNFSVAVWVGYIALFGTAIQTGVVMVVYLDEAVKKKMAERGENFSRADLIQAVKDGARLRLRPKVMTVATVIAGLLPIFWSTRPGSEVMRPLAAPIIGGMVSSLACILIVTPVIFAWLRERELKHRSA
jgi:copper/silver efflux system protein